MTPLKSKEITYEGKSGVFLYNEEEQKEVPKEEEPTQNLIEVWKGETILIEDFPLNKISLPEYADVTKVYEVIEIETLQASWRGARIGKYGDRLRLVPDSEKLDSNKRYIALVTIPRDLPSGRYGNYLVLDKTLPEKPLFPMYMEIQSSQCLRASFKATEIQDWTMEGFQTQKYIDMLRRFWIEPIKHTTTYYPSDIDRDAWGGKEYSFQNVVFDQAIAPPLIWAGQPGPHPPIDWLEKVSGRASQGTMFYGPDEPGHYGMSISEAVERVKYLNSYSKLPVMLTSLPRQEFNNLNVVYCPVRNWLDRAEDMETGIYGSCMAQGNCVNTSSPESRTQFPVHVIEGDPINDWQRSIIDAYEKGAQFYLYYNSTQRLLTCHEPGGLYEQGGNGDGTHFYYDPKTGYPEPSIRLVHYLLALQEVTKRMLS